MPTINLGRVGKPVHESLQSLLTDIQRLTSLAFPGPMNETTEIIAREAFIDALNDPVTALKIREREPLTFDEASRIAVRLESYSNCQSNRNQETSRNDDAVLPRLAKYDKLFTNLNEMMQKQVEWMKQLAQVSTRQSEDRSMYPWERFDPTQYDSLQSAPQHFRSNSSVQLPCAETTTMYTIPS
jgi:hypothetical protein